MRVDLLFLTGVLVSFLLTGCAAAGERLCVREACFSVDVVRTYVDRARGLMFRPALEEGRGMFFVFDTEALHPFWMKNMLFPIDIIWLDRDRRVVHVAANVPPCAVDPCPQYVPSAKASYVLEVPAGDAARHGIKPGDILR